MALAQCRRPDRKLEHVLVDQGSPSVCSPGAGAAPRDRRPHSSRSTSPDARPQRRRDPPRARRHRARRPAPRPGDDVQVRGPRHPGRWGEGPRAGRARERAPPRWPRYCTEIRPLIASGRFATGADLGTSERDFAPLRPEGWDDHVLNSLVDGVPFEDVLTGYGVAVAAEAALGGLEGRTVAVEGLGKVGGGVVREVARRGGRIVAASTIAGAVLDPAGLDPDELLSARAEHGDALVAHLGRTVLPTDALFDAPVDVLVPGARIGVLDAARAARVTAGAVIPAANVPYTADGLATLTARGVAAHADFVCNAAAVVGYWARPDTRQQDVLDHIEAVIAERVEATRDDDAGPFAAACRLADEFLATWCEPDARPDGPPVA